MTDREQLLERISILEERLRQYKDALAPPDVHFAGFTKVQDRALSAFLAHGKLSLDALSVVLYGHLTCEWPADECTRVHVYNLRQKLQHFGIKIGRVYGSGYFISSEDLEKLDKLRI